MSGSPIQRKDMWGKDVFIIKRGNNLILCQKNSEGGKDALRKFTRFDRCFTLDDIGADDWQIIEE